MPRITATCSLNSTDKMDLIAEWHEPVDNPDAFDRKIEITRDSGCGPYWSIRVCRSIPSRYSIA